jgi:Cu(I)/Ag(I) efflux system periplasmic protein CusF
MKSLHTLIATVTLVATSTFSFGVLAQAAAAEPNKMGEMKMDNKTAAVADMTEGEIRKVDKDTKKITIKHGEIKNLEMPGMTMVFQVKDPTMLDLVKAGDKVRFKAEKAGGAIVVTAIEVAK